MFPSNHVSKKIVAAALAIAAQAYPAYADMPLVDEPSRSTLALYAATNFDGFKAIPRYFKFPDSAPTDGVHGIDVSHYQGTVDWQKVDGNRIRFAYVKVSQGDRYFDDQFRSNWSALATRSDKIARGAYHFFSASVDARKQAEYFLSKLGPAAKSDLPACLDLEWDLGPADATGERPDRWAGVTPDEIVQRAKTWLDLVQAATGKQPIIYTNAHWWAGRIGTTKGQVLAPYKMWIADYSSGALNKEIPKALAAPHEWIFWQLTDKGTVPGISGSVDTNRFKLTESELKQLLQ